MRKRVLTYEILYRFWHSLSDYEKQFAREQARFKASSKEPRHYLQIFEFLDGQQSPDEDEAMGHFKGTAIGKDWSFKKHQAFHKLVDFSVEAQTGTEAKLNFCLRANEMLQRKGFPEGHALFLDEALEIAQRIENVAAERKLLKYKKDIIIRHPQEYNVSAEISKIHAREDVLLAMEGQLHRLDQLSDMVDLKRSLFRLDTDLIERVKNDPAMENVEKCLTARARVLFYRIKALVYAQEKQYLKVIHEFIELINTFESNQFLSEDSIMVGIVINAIFDGAILYAKTRNFNEATELFKKIEQYKLEKSDPDRLLRQGTVFYIILYQSQGSYTQFDTLSNNIINRLGHSSSNYSELTRLTLFFTFAQVYFEFGEISKSIYWINRLLMEPEPTVRKDIKYFARVFFIICQFEKKEFDLVKKEIKSCTKYYQRVGLWDDFYNTFFKHLYLAAKSKSNAERKKHLNHLIDELDVLESTNNYIRNFSYFGYKRCIEKWKKE